MSLAVFGPSETLTVIVVLPDSSPAGVTVTVRFVSVPPKTMFAVGTSVVSEELPDTVKLAAAVSTSPMVNAMAAVGVSSPVLWSAISEIVGGSLTAVTVNRKVSLVVAIPSSTVTRGGPKLIERRGHGHGSIGIRAANDDIRIWDQGLIIGTGRER